MLKQTAEPFIDRFGDVLVYFRKTPKDIICPHFWELKWSFGCPFDCAYCYLQGTGRGDKHPRSYHLDSILKKLDDVFRAPLKKLPRNQPIIANSGELSDSLMYPSVIERISDKFEEQSRDKLLLLTKSANVGWLLENQRNQTIVSFSLNSSYVARRWEKKTAPPKKRIKAARDVAEMGYETRIRIDPMFPVENWEQLYCELVDQILGSLEPERITLGSLRGLWKTIKFCKDESWVEYLDEKKTGWGRKINFAKRLSMYSIIKNYLEDEYDYSRIALCKETSEIWRELELDPGTYKGVNQENWEKCRCNCVW